MDQKQIISQLEDTLLVRYGCAMENASPQQVYRALCYVVNGMLASKSAEFYKKNKGKQVFRFAQVEPSSFWCVRVTQEIEQAARNRDGSHIQSHRRKL